jgi:hypothetical protein
MMAVRSSDLQTVGPADDLVLDAGAREKQVDKRDERYQRIATDLQAVDDALGFLIVGDGDGEVHILGEPRLSAERRRQSSDDGPPGTDDIGVRLSGW